MLRILSSFSTYTLLVALFISVISAYYSILGLTAIFSAAVTSIIIMGIALELGKLVAAVWLKLNWSRAGWLYKIYLVPAVAFLMALTSMGIFGFLSKAHSDQDLVGGDVAAQIALYDEKIRISRENIEASRRALKQLDESVEQILGRSTTEAGAARALQARRNQTAERNRILKEIGEEQAKITKLNEDSAAVRAQIRKVEAEVGPIKYIAALIYGDNADRNLLESAVRWVIIMIVVVFDPLALVLVLAAQQSMRWDREGRQRPPPPAVEAPPEYPQDDGALTPQQLQQIRDSVQLAVGEHLKSTILPESREPVELSQQQLDHIKEYIDGLLSRLDSNRVDGLTEQQLAQITALVNSVMPQQVEVVAEGITPSQMEELKSWIMQLIPQPVDSVTPQQLDELKNYVTEIIERIDIRTPVTDASAPRFEQIVALLADIKAGVETPPVQPVAEVLPTPQEPTVDSTITVDEFVNPTVETRNVTKQIVLYDGGTEYINYDGKLTSIEALKEIRPDLVLALRNTRSQNSFDWGAQFPQQSLVGDIYMRTDVRPHRLYKFNGDEWISVDKNSNTSYLSSPQYLQFLIDALNSRTYLPEMLSELEEDSIREHLSKQ